MTTQSRSQRHRQRRRERGYKQLNLWIDADAAQALRSLQAIDAADAYTVVSAALKHYYAAQRILTGDSHG